MYIVVIHNCAYIQIKTVIIRLLLYVIYNIAVND